MAIWMGVSSFRFQQENVLYVLSRDRFCKRDTICKTPSPPLHVDILPPVK